PHPAPNPKTARPPKAPAIKPRPRMAAPASLQQITSEKQHPHPRRHHHIQRPRNHHYQRSNHRLHIPKLPRLRHPAAMRGTAQNGARSQLAAHVRQQPQDGLAHEHAADAREQHEQRGQVGGPAQHALGLDGEGGGHRAHGQALLQVHGQSEGLCEPDGG
ncbi:conserved hypothetical protein, partial [Ricinus communis]